MGHVFLVHWKEDELAAFSEPLRDAGWRVDTASDHARTAVERIARLRPDVVVVGLRRDPDESRLLAELLAGDDAARDLPVVTVDGTDDAIAAMRQALPSVTSVTWEELPGTLRELVPQRAS